MACCLIAPICYMNITPCDVAPSQGAALPAVLPFSTASLVTPFVVATGVSACGNQVITAQQGANQVIDNSLSGAAACVLRNNRLTGLDTAFTLRFTTPQDGVRGFRTYHGYGGVFTDSDGFRTARVRAFNVADAMIGGPYAVPAINNGGAIDINFPTTLNGVSYMIVDEIIPWQATCLGIREFQALHAYQSTVSWACGGSLYRGVISGQTAGVVVANGNLTQTNGPHTIQFSAGAGEVFSGEIITDNPSHFSSLTFDQNSGLITISGNGTVTFAVRFYPQQVIRSGFATIEGNQVVYRDAATGDILQPGGFELVPCLGGTL